LITPERYLVVSLGSIGRRHLANLRFLRPSATIGVLRLTTHHVAEDLSEHCDRLFNNIDEAVRFRPEAAIISSPASTHIAIASALAQSKINLFIEKPLAVSRMEACELEQQMTASGLVGMIGYCLRFMPGLQKVKKLVDDSVVGSVLCARAAVGQYLPNWRARQDYRKTVSAQAMLGGGALLELSHELDYLLWMFGTPATVHAVGGKLSDLEIDVEDTIELTMHYSNRGPLVSVHLDFLDQAGFRELRIIGSEGSLTWDATTDEVKLFLTKNRTWQTIRPEASAKHNDIYLDELKHFLACVDAKEATTIPIQDGVDVLAVVDACHKSLQTGQIAKVIQ
jgi:predicted dehydrogenase